MAEEDLVLGLEGILGFAGELSGRVDDVETMIQLSREVFDAWAVADVPWRSLIDLLTELDLGDWAVSEEQSVLASKLFAEWQQASRRLDDDRAELRDHMLLLPALLWNGTATASEDSSV